MFCGYTRAEELFEAVRSASSERMSALRQIETLEARRGVSSPAFCRGAPSADRNGVSGTIELLDYRSLMQARIESDERLIALASSILYGEKGRGGVAAALSSRHADAVFWRYVCGEPWKVCCAVMDESARTLQRLCRESFALCDERGAGSLVADDAR